MNATTHFFTPYMDIVFFFYGLAFFSLGIVIINRQSRFELSQFINYLGAFAVIHSLLEWINLWRILRGTNQPLELIRVIILAGSFFFLFEFGRRLIFVTTASCPLLQAKLLYPLLAITILIVLGVASDPKLAFEISARYLFGFCGAIMSGWGLNRYYQVKIKPVIYAPDVPYLQSLYKSDSFWYMKYACYAAIIGFYSYAFLGGLVVPKTEVFFGNWLNYDSFLAILGFPVQVARTGCAIILSIAMAIVLRLLQLEITFENYRIQLNANSSGIYSTDVEDRITFINNTACDILGYRIEQLLGRPAHATFHYKHPDGVLYPADNCPLRATLTHGNIVNNDQEVFWTAEGHQIAVSYTGQPIQFKGRIIGTVVSFITCARGTRPEHKWRRRTDPQI